MPFLPTMTGDGLNMFKPTVCTYRIYLNSQTWGWLTIALLTLLHPQTGNPCFTTDCQEIVRMAGMGMAGAWWLAALVGYHVLYA